MKRLFRNLADNPFVVLTAIVLVAIGLVKGAEALQTVSSGGGGGGGSISVEEGGTEKLSAATTLNFSSGATITDAGSGQADIAISGGSASAPLELDQTGDSLAWYTTGTNIDSYVYDIQATYSLSALGGADNALHGSTSGSEIWWFAGDSSSLSDWGGMLILRSNSDSGEAAILQNVSSGRVISIGGGSGTPGSGTGTTVKVTSPAEVEMGFNRTLQTISSASTVDTSNGSVVVCDTTSSGFTLTLPSSPGGGDTLQIFNESSNTCTLSHTNGVNGTTSLASDGAGTVCTYKDATDGWYCL